EHDDRYRADAVVLLHPSQHLPAVDMRHHHVEEDQVGLRLLDRRHALLGARGLAHGVALELEVDADELAHPLVVVDEEDERAGPTLPSRSRAVEEVLQVEAAVAPVPAGGVEGRDAALVGPLANRALRHAQEAGRLAERQPLGLTASAAAAWIIPERHLAGESTQNSTFLT